MSALYAFSDHTFTNASATGRTGPILSAVRTAYSNAAWAQDTTNNWLNMTSDNGIQLWTVPATGAYVIKAAGAGGNGGITSNAGRGYIITSTHNLTQGQIIKILVGQVGTSAYGKGGGGGTFIATNTNTPLVVCGGGGGINFNESSTREDARGTGGTDTAGADGDGGGTGGCGMNGSGGASFTYNSTYAKSFVNGGVGGPMPDLGCVPISYGGFGGGGGGGNGGGGGGGYTGGKGGSNNPYISGYGGGSYCSTTVTSTDYNIAGAEGYVTVTYTAAAEYESTFSAHTFTNAGATGRTGPTLSAVRTAYSNAAWAQDTTNNWLNMTSDNGIQLWTVPKTGTYTIEARGARGGNADTATGGLGARIKISTTLVKNNIIKILCGQQGGTASVASIYGHPAIAGGGGGGTYIYNITTSSIILIAGGGGGAAKGSLDSSYIPAKYIWDGSNASAYNVLSGTDGRSSAGASGKGGSDGNAGTTGNGGGSSGAGWNGPGVKGTYGGGVGLSFNSGGTGGENIVHNGSFVINTEGGFGGGSGAGVHLNYESDAGGGGGYSGGGGGGAVLGTGGGGGNYMITGSTYISSSTNSGHGSVTVTYTPPIITAAEYESTFSAHTFTSAGATGRTGPILSAVRTAYSNAEWAQDITNNWLNMTSNNGIQLWTVPKTGTYTIDAYGGGTPCGGAGGRIQGNFNLTKGSILSIVCGQVSTGATGWGNWYGEGGGGGTYVCVGDRIKSNMLCVAGGGGGSTNNDSANLRSDGTKYGGWSVSVIGDSDAGGAVLGGNGSGSGGGVSGDGFLQSPQPGTQPAKSFGNGSMGGYNTTYPIGYGGFGGGGNGGGQPGGGGGGFRGGDTGFNNIGGQGGTSYILASATNAVNTTGGGGASQPGKVIITLIRTSPATLSFIKNVYYQKYIINSTFSIPSSSIITSNTDTSSFSVTHSSPGNAGIITVTNSANTGTVTVKGIGTVTITSTISATANFTETTVALITVVIVGAGTRYSNLDLNSIDLSATDITGTTFSGCDLTSANLYGSTISSTTDFSTVTSMSSLRSGRIIGVTTLLPTGYKLI